MLPELHDPGYNVSMPDPKRQPQRLCGKNKEPQLQVEYEFPGGGSHSIACKVQDDMGGEGLWTGEIKVQ